MTKLDLDCSLLQKMKINYIFDNSFRYYNGISRPLQLKCSLFPSEDVQFGEQYEQDEPGPRAAGEGRAGPGAGRGQGTGRVE